MSLKNDDVRKVRGNADIGKTAASMFRRHGASFAQELAYGYATGAYPERPKLGRKFWFAVWDEVQRIYEDKR